MSWKPWNAYPGLTIDRLVSVAALIRTARDGAADDHRPECYEGNWSLGVRCYERTCGVLINAAQSHEWLHIVTGAKGGPVHFVISIGGHAVRFYHGTPEDIPDRYRQPSFPELFEQQHALKLDGNLPVNRSLRIAIENDQAGRPDSIRLIEMTHEGVPTNTFLIPLLGQVAIAAFGTANEPPANIPPVSAEPVDDHQKDDGSTIKKTGSDDE